MNTDASIIIKTGCSLFASSRKHFIDYENNPPNKYAMLHICIRNDFAIGDERTLYIFYGNSKDCFNDYIMTHGDFDNDDKHLLLDFMNYEKIWIDEWVRKRNGDLYKLYKIDNVENETAKSMIKRMLKRIRGNDEHDFELEDKEIYRLDQMELILPDTFEIFHWYKLEDVNKALGCTNS